MMNVPNHLLQPLFIDTNINYDLDMSKFPGLDDPQHMYEPALLIATDWSDYVYLDEDTESDSSSDSSASFEDDLFSLIESCEMIMPEMDTSAIDSDTFQTLLDDVITDTVVPCDVLQFLDTPDISPNSVTDSECYSANENSLDIVDGNFVTTTEDVPPFTSCVRGQKRRRSSDSEYPYTKKSKVADSHSLRLPALVSVCPTSNNCVMHRDS